MEGGAAAAVQVLVQNLIDLCKKEISQIRGLDKDAAKLAGNLDMIKNFLNDAETRTITSGAVKSWLKKLEDVAFDADNVLDEINYNILSDQIMPIEPKKEKVPSHLSCFSCCKNLSRSRNMALQINDINENLESINKKATELGLVGRLADEPTLVITSLETDSFSDDPFFIGRDDVKLEIVEKLTNSIATGERKVSIISIVGMGGLGKTTLTRKVFNHEMVKPRFGSHIWVHVSPNFDALTLFKKILKELTDQVEGESKQDILSKLKQSLKDKTYLLVLDDVWNENLSAWEDFMSSLLGVSCVKGNAIVVTTRSLKVASILNPLHTHELKGLSEEECWSIIREKAFQKEDVPSEFETIGKKIARKCQGLPLAANVVGGILRNQSEEKWRSVEEEWLSPDEGRDSITKILRLSFDNLSLPSLKKCFAYCAMFPKGSKISKRKLIEFWMGEGFLQADGSNDMESVGEKFINVLLHNSLLQVSKRDDYKNVKSCGMHDLVHDLACSVSSFFNSTGGSSRIRYMSLKDESSCIPKEMAKYLRTLLLEGDSSGINFSDYESLHVLRLHSGVKKLSSSIRKLIHLRHLDISKTWIHYLPDWIGEFFHLQTLRVHSGRLTKLPSTIRYLINLRHLYINRWAQLPMGIGRLTSLQTLKYFGVGDENGCKIEELGSLNNLSGDLEIRNLGRVHDKDEVVKANLFKKSKLLKLCLKWGDDREGETNDEDVLEGLQPHSDLRELEISGFNGKRFPSWTQKMSVRDAPQGSWVVLNKLMSLELSYCRECEEIPMLWHLPNLEKLILWSMPKLTEWAEIEISDGSEVKLFPRLRYLRFYKCEQLVSVPSHVSSCLEELRIHKMGVECLPADWLFSNKQTLSYLEIEDCPNLREISDSGGEQQSQGRSFTSLPKFPRLTKLTIIHVPKLSLETVDAMRRLEIDGSKYIDPDPYY